MTPSSICTQGADLEELTRAKRVAQFAVYTAYRLRLETAFLADECASAAAVAMVADERAPATMDRAHSFPNQQRSGELAPSNAVAMARKAASATVSPDRAVSPRRGVPDSGLLPPAAEAAQRLNHSKSAASMLDRSSLLRLAAPRALSSAASVGSSQAVVGDGMSRVPSATLLGTDKQGRAGTGHELCMLAQGRGLLTIHIWVSCSNICQILRSLIRANV